MQFLIVTVTNRRKETEMESTYSYTLFLAMPSHFSSAVRVSNMGEGRILGGRRGAEAGPQRKRWCVGGGAMVLARVAPPPHC